MSPNTNPRPSAAKTAFVGFSRMYASPSVCQVLALDCASDHALSAAPRNSRALLSAVRRSSSALCSAARRISYAFALAAVLKSSAAAFTWSLALSAASWGFCCSSIISLQSLNLFSRKTCLNWNLCVTVRKSKAPRSHEK